MLTSPWDIYSLTKLYNISEQRSFHRLNKLWIMNGGVNHTPTATSMYLLWPFGKVEAEKRKLRRVMDYKVGHLTEKFTCHSSTSKHFKVVRRHIFWLNYGKEVTPSFYQGLMKLSVRCSYCLEDYYGRKGKIKVSLDNIFVTRNINFYRRKFNLLLYK